MGNEGNDVRRRIEALVESARFRNVVLATIIAGAVIVGLETSPTIVERFGGVLLALDAVVLLIFGIEALLKMAAHGTRFWRYFRDPWNVFDFTILAVCLAPFGGHYAAVLRLARVLRALRLVAALPRLQLLVAALLRSIPSMGYIGALLFLHFYVYGVLGVFLFRGNDPVHFGDLPTALLTLFRVITLEDWTDVMYTQMYGSDVYAQGAMALAAEAPQAMPLVGAGYFISFVLFGTMIMLNLFIGVIVNGMSEAQEQVDDAREDKVELEERVRELERQLESSLQGVRRLRGELSAAGRETR